MTRLICGTLALIDKKFFSDALCALDHCVLQ